MVPGVLAVPPGEHPLEMRGDTPERVTSRATDFLAPPLAVGDQARGVNRNQPVDPRQQHSAARLIQTEVRKKLCQTLSPFVQVCIADSAIALRTAAALHELRQLLAVDIHF